VARGIRHGNLSFPARRQEIAEGLGQLFFLDQFSVVKNADGIKPPRRQNAVCFDKLPRDFAAEGGMNLSKTPSDFKNNAGQRVADVAVASKIYSLARRNGIGMEF
jgi:hypothetical protein